MSVNVLFSDNDAAWKAWEDPLRAALADAKIDADLQRSDAQPSQIDYIVYSPASPLQNFTPFTRLKAVLSMWAGVETIVGNKTLTVPLARMVDPGLTDGMVEYVTGHVLRYHLGMDAHVANPDAAWRPDLSPPLARSRTVGILGLGALGQACGHALRALNFEVHGWSRGPKSIETITCHHGASGLDDILAACQIMVLLLPNTPATQDLITTDRLMQMPKGSYLINPGRGPLIVDDALIDALDRSHLAHATLDVFREEPLPPEHPFWQHPKITITPHIAAETRAETAASVIVENIRRGEAGEPFLNLVDVAAGY